MKATPTTVLEWLAMGVELDVVNQKKLDEIIEGLLKGKDKKDDELSIAITITITFR